MSPLIYNYKITLSIFYKKFLSSLFANKYLQKIYINCIINKFHDINAYFRTINHLHKSSISGSISSGTRIWLLRKKGNNNVFISTTKRGKIICTTEYDYESIL